MRKKAAALVIGILLLAVNLYAADGDFIVNGKLGVGVTNPTDTKLQLNGDLGVSSGKAVVNYTSGGCNYGTQSWAPFTVTDSNDSLGIYEAATNVMAIGTRLDCSTSPANLSLLPAGGSIGVGTTDASLGGRVSSKFTITTDGTGFAIGRANGTPSFAINPATDYSWIMYDYYNSSWNQSVASKGGNVGIGTASPTYLLSMEASGGGYYNQSTHSWYNGSSGRWKSGLRPITGALDTVLKLNGISFNWKKRTDIFETKIDGRKEYISSSWADDPNGRNDIGLVGEEVMKVLPQVVDLDQKDTNFVTGVAYSKIAPLLIEAIKEQQKQIEALKSEVAALKGQK